MASKQDIQAGRAYVRLFLKNDMRKQLAGALKSAGGKLKGFGRGAMVAGAGVTAAGAAILGPLTMAVKSFAAQGDELDKMSQRTGIAASELAGIGFAAEQSGTDLQAFEKSVKRMQGTLTDAELGLSTALDGLDMVGLKFEELEGLSPEEQFQRIADGVAAIEDPSKKAAAAQKLFGKSGVMLLPMLDNMRELRKEARDLGIMPSQEEIDNAAKVTDAINRVKRAVKAMFFNVGSGLAEPALQFLKVLKQLAVSAGKFAKNKGALLATVAALGAVLVVGGTALTAFGIALWSAGVALSALGTVVGVLLSPIGLITAAVVAGAVAWVKYTDSGKRAWETLKAAVLPIIETLKVSFGGIKDALMSGEWGLAGQIAMTGLKLAVFQGLGAIQAAFPQTFGTILRVVGKIGDGIVAAWGKVTGFLLGQWNAWGKHAVAGAAGAAAAIVDVWQKSVEGMANWMLGVSAKGGVMGKAMSKVLGVDMSEEQARAEMDNRDVIANLRETIASLEKDLAAATDEDTRQRLREDVRAFKGDLQSLEGAGAVDTLADARAAVKDYVDQMRADVATLGADPGTGSVSEGLEAFLAKLESGTGVADAQKELDALIEKAAKLRAEAAKKDKAKKDKAGAGGAGQVSAAAPTGPALTATYSAAAASIAGFQAGGPEDKMVAGIDAVDKSVTKVLHKLIEGVVSLDQFLAGMRVP